MTICLIGLAMSNRTRAELVGYWDFNDDVLDRSAQGNNGTLNGDATFDNDRPKQTSTGKSLIVDGSGDYVDLGNPSVLNFGTNNWTVAAWVRTTQSVGTGTIFSNGGDNPGGIRYVASVDLNSFRLITDDDAIKRTLTGTRVVNDDAWHHVVAQREGAALRTYIDGQLESTGSVPAGYDLSGTSQENAYIGCGWVFGGSAPVKLLTGRVDDVALWDEAIPEGTISRLAEGTLTPSGPAGPTFNVDFGRSTSVVQSGYERADNPVEGPPLPNSITFDFNNAFDTGQQVSATVVDANRWKNRNPITGDFTHLSDLLRDFGGIVQSGVQTISLSLDVPAGNYYLTSYHHTRNYTPGTADVTLTDAANPTGTAAGSVTGSTGSSPTSIGLFATSFQSDGVNPITLDYTITNPNHFAINGFDLERELFITSVDRQGGGTAGTDDTDPGIVGLAFATGASGVTIYSDRSYTWQAAPSVLDGADYVQTFNDDKYPGADGVSYEVMLAGPARIFLMVDNRNADLQAEVDAINSVAGLNFLDTGAEILTDTSMAFSIFYADALAGGTYVFMDQVANTNSFYAIAAIAHVPEPGTIVLLALGGLGLLLSLRHRMRQGC